MSLSLGTPYVLLRDVLTTSIDDDGRARFPEDTLLLAGTEFVVVEGKQPWPEPNSRTLYYFVEPHVSGTDLRLGSIYAARAADIESAVRAAAA